MTRTFKTVEELDFGPNDAQDYNTGTDQQLLRRIFLIDDNLQSLCRNRSIYFLIGEKGSGKTAYATYVSKFGVDDVSAFDLFMSPQDYLNLAKVAQRLNLDHQDYHLVWEVILLLFLAHSSARPGEPTISDPPLLQAVRALIDKYAMFTNRPTVEAIFNLFEALPQFMADLSKLTGISQPPHDQASGRPYISAARLMLASVLNQHRRGSPFLLFLDGIDVRPGDFSGGFTQSDFMSIVRALVTAVWNANTHILSSDASLRTVLLIRPDIFDQTGLQNLNAKVRDNAILFNWFTPYSSYRKSRLFRLADGLFSHQQDGGPFTLGDCWDQYFPYKELSRNFSSGDDFREEHSFIPFLRSSFYRPRDIVTMLRIFQRDLLSASRGADTAFEKGLMYRNTVRHEYSDYLLNEVRDGLGFYYTEDVLALFKQFFEYLAANGFDPRRREFSYSTLESSFNDLQRYVDKNKLEMPAAFETADKFLQVLYELNVIGYTEIGVKRDRITAWSFRQRSVSNVRPSVKTKTEYVLHYGLARALYPERVS